MARREADVLIVGAGPSGSVAAHTLSSAGMNVVCLEQGDWTSPADYPGNRAEYELLVQKQWSWNPNIRRRPADYPLNVSGSDLDPLLFSGVGGSSIMFAAHWMRLKPSDFRLRSQEGICDDWPISYEDLHPYYNRIDQFLGVSGLGGDPAYPEQDFAMPPHPMGKGGMRMARAMNELGWHWWPGTQAIPTAKHKNLAQCVRWGACEAGCPAGAKASFDLGYWPHAISAGAKLVTGARVREITVDARGMASGATWIDREGREHHQKARVVVLAANSIGTARLLLLSKTKAFPEGLANSSGLVGKNLMLHPCAEAVGLYDDDVESWRGPAGQLMYSLQFYETDPSRGFHRGAKMNLMPRPGVLSILREFDGLPFHQRWGSAIHELDRFAGHALSWSGIVEDLPEETNQVTLDSELTDSDGILAPRVHYRISENSRKSLAFMVDRMAEMHQTAGARHIFRYPLTSQPGHLLGTARCGADPKRSVVDAWGRAHDVSNLFVVDGSVMTTGGAANPTATITAWALRTAEHIIATRRDIAA